MEALEPCVRHATARTEARKDIIFDGTEQRNILRIHGQVSGRGGPSQESGVFGREGIGTVPWVVIHNTAGDHRPQPFAHVTLVEAATRRDRFTTRGWHVCHDVEQPCPVAQRSHQTKRPIIQGADQALLESCGPRVIEWNGVRHELLRCRDKIKDISPSSNSSPSVTVVRIVAERTSASKRTARGEITFSKTTDFERILLKCNPTHRLRDL